MTLNPNSAVYMAPAPGAIFFLHYAREYGILPDDDNLTSRSGKATLRLIVSFVALRFFLDIGFYFNLISIGVKGCLGMLACKNDRTIGDFTAHQFGQDVKRHLIFLIVDVATAMFMSYFYFVFVFFPLRLEWFIGRLKEIVYKDCPLQIEYVGEPHVEIVTI